jgi:ribosome-associated toxin RatA of RatAB toxin-antitoxin module
LHALPPGVTGRLVSEYRESYSTRVAATPEQCFAVLTDFESYPRWSSPVRECRVLTRHPDELPKHVAFVLDTPIKTIRYTLDYTWDPPNGGEWRLVEGDVAGVEGSYEFAPAKSGCTATCTQSIDLGFWVPGFLRSAFERKALRDSVEEFRAAVEAHA